MLLKKINKIFHRLFFTRSNWSISVYKTSDILNSHQLHTVKKPTITVFDVSDCLARGVADPFIVESLNKYYIFFEIEKVYGNKEVKGVIGVAISNDGVSYQYGGVVLEEDYHLSYPAIYKIDSKFYMIPESGENESVDLYESVKFPYKWKKVKTLLSGEQYADSTLLNYFNKWYLFTYYDLSLNIFVSDRFDGPYNPHKKNPIYANNKSISRPSGSFIVDNDNIWRVSQDFSKKYGEKVHLLKINSLSTKLFDESYVKVLLQPSFLNNWYGSHMHHASYIRRGNGYIVAVDSKGVMYRYRRFIKRILR